MRSLIHVCLVAVACCTANGASNETSLPPLQHAQGSVGRPGVRIAFGSCSKTWLDQHLWPAITARKPDLWIWAGDNVYLDQKRWGTGPFPIFHETTPEIIAREYKLQLNDENYKKLMETTPILGVWDDHDYGLNDGDRHLGDIRHVTRDALLNFVEHGQHPSLLRPERRTRADGVYTAYRLPTQNGPAIGIVLLDTRWNKDKTHLLGAAQWQWLEQTMIGFRDSGVAVTFVVSPTQVLGRYRMYVESWQSYPAERERLMQLFHTANHSTILLSGDVHFAEFSMVQCVAAPIRETLDAESARIAGGTSTSDVLEVTSSGLTHSWDSPLWRLYLMHLAHAVLPFQSSFAYKLEPNFGELDIDWETNSIAARVFGNGGSLLLEHTFDLQQLRPSAPYEAHTPVHVSCAPIRGHVSPVHLVAAYGIFVVVALSPLWGPVLVLYMIARWLLRDCRNDGTSKQQWLAARTKLGKSD